MDLFSRRRCEEVFEAVVNAARPAGVTEVEALMGARRSALTRFANNRIHQNVAQQGGSLSIRVITGGRTARATTNQFDRDSIGRAVAQAIAITRSSEPYADLMPLLGPQQYADVRRHHPDTAAAAPEDRAKAVVEAIGIVEAAGQTAAGIFETEESVSALMNSEGLVAYYPETSATFSITALGADSSGWAKAQSPRALDIDHAELATTASRKAAASAAPREISPGRYTVVLQPAAVLDLLGQMVGDFSATAIEDQRSFLNERLNRKTFGGNITIYDDVYHPLQTGAPWDGEGVPRSRLTLVSAGVPGEIAWCRSRAAAAGRNATGHGYPLPNEYGEGPVNIVVAGGDSTVEQMIASTDRGILVTRLWYIREVDPYEKIMTGMTRDGTFLIEDGRLVSGLHNFRFNVSLVEMLNQVEAMSAPVRAAGEESFEMVAPAMKVNRFNFSEVTKF
ncbi:MAG: TldD/PmbA family protein [Bryobacterales bacterium]|nr:TldD/PmbA family protein [Bryobacterales bacterium]